MNNKNIESVLKRRYLWILSRCKYTNHKSSYIYVDKWIKCEWNSFEEFYRDMSPTYQEWFSIDRIDWSKNYCKENCRWADRKTQNNNRSNNIIVDWGLTLWQWIEKEWYSDIKQSIYKLNKKKLPFEELKTKARKIFEHTVYLRNRTDEDKKKKYSSYQNSYYLKVTKKKRKNKRIIQRTAIGTAISTEIDNK